MNKLKLITILVLSAVLLQNCKKDTVTAVTTSTAPLQATINGATWLPDTISTTITYNAETKNKTLSCEGTFAQKRVNIAITLHNATNDANFATGSYTVDGGPDVLMKYSTQQKNSEGNYVFVDQGSVAPGSGTIAITSVDPVKKVITGTFSLIVRTPVYDDSGNIVSILITTVSYGIFNSLPYSFSTN